jgi:hypothetical protein
VKSSPSSGTARLFTSTRSRIFLAAWIVYSAHFATNVVREHYPAFAIVDHATFRVDEYQGFHSDIFVHRDGHSVIGNQVLVSVLAAAPLFVFDPALDALEAYRQRQIAARGIENAEYRNEDRPVSAEFFRLVRERGLDLRFGAATAVTTVFFMAPLTAWFLVVFFDLLRKRGVTAAEAGGLTALLAFSTPLFFRTTGLNHNMFVLYFTFAAFLLLWQRRAPDGAVPRLHRLGAGLCCGLILATDYIGVVMLPVIYGYFLLPRWRTTAFAPAFRESLDLVVGSLPAVGFLLFSQWAMYGNPFLPGQYWMPNQNVYVNEGMRGFTGLDFELLLQNLFHPGFGLYVWGPVLALALVPTHWYASSTLVLPRTERRFVAALFLAMLLFCSINQYARLQWNSGFRYLVPLVPLLVLALADHWVRLPRPARLALGLGAGLHSWVLTVYRETATRSWELFLTEGPQLPWLRVMRMTASPDNYWLNAWWPPVVLLAVVAVIAIAVWPRRPDTGRAAA